MTSSKAKTTGTVLLLIAVLTLIVAAIKHVLDNE